MSHSVPRPIVVRRGEATTPPGPQTPGMERRLFLEDEDRWLGWVRTKPSVASGWHHHGDRDTYIFMISGSIAIEYGAGGRDRITPEAGDVAYLPALTVHREITGTDAPGEAFIVRVGDGPQTVNVEGPDPD